MAPAPAVDPSGSDYMSDHERAASAKMLLNRLQVPLAQALADEQNKTHGEDIMPPRSVIAVTKDTGALQADNELLKGDNELLKANNELLKAYNEHLKEQSKVVKQKVDRLTERLDVMDKFNGDLVKVFVRYQTTADGDAHRAVSPPHTGLASLSNICRFGN